MEVHLQIGCFFLLATVSGMYRGLGDKYVIRMDELVRPLDRHVRHITKPAAFSRRLVRRKVRNPSSVFRRFSRSADGDQNKSGFSLPAQDRSGRVEILTKHSVGQCGNQQIHFEPKLHSTRIRNGTCTPYGAFPWTVQIQVLENRQYEHRCGGSLISDLHVLTARHCFGGVKPNDLRVVVGQYDMNSRDAREVAFGIEKIWLHKDYQSEGPYSHDLALIKLKRKGDGSAVRFTPEVSPVCLPDHGYRYRDNLNCVISGWGKTEPHTPVRPDCLRAAKVPILNQDKCKVNYAHSSQKLIDSMMCAGYPSGGVDACKGDSGGPLACYVDGSYKLVGVISWGLGCGKAGMPGVFTRVQHYLDWIENKM